jgi:dihydrofolate reductase
MRKIVMLNQVSIDGYFAGPNGEIDWFVHTPEIGHAAHAMMDPDTVILGRVTYDTFSNFWPDIADDENSSDDMRQTSKELNEMTKLVVSNSLEKVSWTNSKLITGDLINEIKVIKAGEGKDITIFGSGTIVQQLSNEGLIDEYIIQISPIVLGRGKPLFNNVNEINMRLIESVSVSGCVINHYRV